MNFDLYLRITGNEVISIWQALALCSTMGLFIIIISLVPASEIKYLASPSPDGL
jgi:hypothetical protein